MRRLRVRVRVRRRRTLTLISEPELLAEQSRRLAPFRDRLLRRVSPGLRGATLDLACGSGSITSELAGRVGGPVIALDVDGAALRRANGAALRVRGDANALPFRAGAFDLVVTQAAWLWFRDVAAVAGEVLRVLGDGGALVALGEPDFGGAIDHPPEASLAPIWESALRRAGADPRGARRLPGALEHAGFSRVETEIFGALEPSSGVPALREAEARRLRGLPLTQAEEAAIDEALEASRHARGALAFVPLLGVLAHR